MNRHESSNWAIATNQMAREYIDLRDKILTDAAARGFPITPGDALMQLLEAGLKIRQKLTELGGKIYEEERGRIFELADFNLKMIIENAKLAMLVYRNALKRYEEDAAHQLREQEIIHELLVEEEEIALAALRVLQIQVRLILQQYENDIRAQVLALKILLDEAKIDLGLLVHLTRLTIHEQAQITLDKNEANNVFNILAIELLNLQTITKDPAAGKVVLERASGKTITRVHTTAIEDKLIGKLGG